MSFLSLERLEKTYPGGTRAVVGLDLAIEEGELVVLLGPSGCGKTSTLRMIAGLEAASEGIIRLGGCDVTRLPASSRNVGMVFQLYALYPHLRVRDNIGFPLRAARIPQNEIRARVAAVAERMGLGPLLDLFPRQLAGGDQQKVSLARAIVRRPSVYLMDEPLGTLDTDQRLAMRELIRAEQLASGVTTIYVTHDQEEALSLADRIVVMEGGTIRQVGTPDEVYDRPANRFVAAFVGSPGMNFISGEVSHEDGGSVFISQRGQLRVAVPSPSHFGRVTLGIRSEHLQEDPRGELVGRIVNEEYLGNGCNVHVETGCGRVVMRGRSAPIRSLGSEVCLQLDPSQISIFDAATELRV